MQTILEIWEKIYQQTNKQTYKNHGKNFSK